VAAQCPCHSARRIGRGMGTRMARRGGSPPEIGCARGWRRRLVWAGVQLRDLKVGVRQRGVAKPIPKLV